MAENRYKQLFSDSVVYTVGGAISRAVGFFMLPVYTRIFTLSEYGSIDMLVTINAFLVALINMGMESALSFYFFEQKKNGRKAQAVIVSSILQWKVISGSVLVLLACLASPLLNKLLFGGELTIWHFLITFSYGLFSQVLKQCSDTYRLLYKPWKFILLNLGNSLLGAGLIIILVIFLGTGIKGYFLGSVIAALILSIIGWRSLKTYLDFSRFHTNWWPELIKFGAPLIPVALGVYILRASDRWFISAYLGQDMLGIYAVGAKMAIIIFMLIQTFRQAWLPIAMDVINNDQDPAFFRKVSRFYLGMGSLAILYLTAISPYLIKFLATPDFYESYVLVGILTWNALFYGFQAILSVGLWKVKKTAWASFSVLVAALCNIIFNAYAVPRYGYVGAAISTAISYVIWNTLTLIIAERFFRIRFPFIYFILQLTFSFVVTYVILYIYRNPVSDLLIIPLVALSTIVLILLSLNPGDFREIYVFLLGKINGSKQK
jgi:O-antigen/teichoic acid export membrane protein